MIRLEEDTYHYFDLVTERFETMFNSVLDHTAYATAYIKEFSSANLNEFSNKVCIVQQELAKSSIEIFTDFYDTFLEQLKATGMDYSAEDTFRTKAAQNRCKLTENSRRAQGLEMLNTHTHTYRIPDQKDELYSIYSDFEKDYESFSVPEPQNDEIFTRSVSKFYQALKIRVESALEEVNKLFSGLGLKLNEDARAAEQSADQEAEETIKKVNFETMMPSFIAGAAAVKRGLDSAKSKMEDLSDDTLGDSAEKAVGVLKFGVDKLTKNMGKIESALGKIPFMRYKDIDLGDLKEFADKVKDFTTLYSCIKSILGDLSIENNPLTTVALSLVALCFGKNMVDKLGKFEKVIGKCLKIKGMASKAISIPKAFIAPSFKNIQTAVKNSIGFLDSATKLISKIDKDYYGKHGNKHLMSNTASHMRG